MDRLETDFAASGELRVYEIYIPVWIDQKPHCLYIYYTLYFNLHSSMDRLETLP